MESLTVMLKKGKLWAGQFLATNTMEPREKRIVSLTRRAVSQGKLKEYNAQIASLQAEIIHCKTQIKELDIIIIKLIAEVETTSGQEQTNRQRWLAGKIAEKKKIMLRAKALAKQIGLIQEKIIRLKNSLN